jgi:ArsR family transcriptional regulator
MPFLLLDIFSNLLGDESKIKKTFQINLMQVSTSDLTQIWAGFHALSEPLRLQIIELLHSQELCVCELCHKLEVNQSKLSFHLKTLKEANLVRARQEGRWIYYSLNLAQFIILEQYLAEFRRFGDILPARGCD